VISKFNTPVLSLLQDTNKDGKANKKNPNKFSMGIEA